MNYVVDASVALCWVIRRPLTPKALQLRSDYSQGSHQLLAPSVFAAEAASALTKSERQKAIAIGEAELLLDDILRTPPVFHPFEPLLRRATAISSRARAGLYDCLYVALAEREGCEVVMADDRAISNLRPSFPFVVPLASLP